MGAKPATEVKNTGIPELDLSPYSVSAILRRAAGRTQLAASGDLGLPRPMSRPTRNGQRIVILGSVTTPGQYEAGVEKSLTAHPGAFYLRTDQTCPSLRAATDDGNPI